MELDTARDQLIEACAIFKRMTEETLHTITTGSFSVFGSNQLYLYITGAATFEANPKEFKSFCECLYDIESATASYSPLTKGLLFKHKLHPLEYHFLKLQGSRFDINDILEYNINTNPSLIRVCSVVKEALKESEVIEKLKTYKSVETPKPDYKPQQRSAEEVAAVVSKLPKPSALGAANKTPPQDFIEEQCRS